MEFQKIALKDSLAIARLSCIASEIVKEYYDPIIGSAMNDYMIAIFQSVSAITYQLLGGYQYYFVKDNDTILGFLAWYPQGKVLHLSKFYLYGHQRGKGYGRQMLDFLIQLGKDNDLKIIELNVNRRNPTIQTYQKFGFTIIGEENNNIGNGYVMNDHVLVRNIV